MTSFSHFSSHDPDAPSHSPDADSPSSLSAESPSSSPIASSVQPLSSPLTSSEIEAKRDTLLGRKLSDIRKVTDTAREEGNKQNESVIRSYTVEVGKQVASLASELSGPRMTASPSIAITASSVQPLGSLANAELSLSSSSEKTSFSQNSLTSPSGATPRASALSLHSSGRGNASFSSFSRPFSLSQGTTSFTGGRTFLGHGAGSSSRHQLKPRRRAATLDVDALLYDKMKAHLEYLTWKKDITLALKIFAFTHFQKEDELLERVLSSSNLSEEEKDEIFTLIHQYRTQLH